MVKSVLTKLMAGMFGAMIIMSAGSMVSANNHSDTMAKLSVDETVGQADAYTNGRYKEDTSYGYIKGISSTNGYDYDAALVGCNRNGGDEYYENFRLYYSTVRGQNEYFLYNFVKESGYDYAAIKTSSDVYTPYHFTFLWSPDSIGGPN